MEAPTHPALNETDLHRAALDVLFTLSIFTAAESVAFSRELWYKHPDAVRRFIAARTVQLESLENMRGFTSALMGGYDNEAERIFPALERVELIGISIHEESAVVSTLALIGMLHGLYTRHMCLELRGCSVGGVAIVRLEERMRPWPIRRRS